ncbi:MAG: hypothetical protein D4R70_02350 [Betaproteobacteria bacterium]|nr:MAG: hypothetical protein D4R70_02350 [Betaproteobacteria bacterium]
MSSPCDIQKRREICFHATPPGQIERALPLLAGLPRLSARQTGAQCIEVAYCVQEYTLQALEVGLTGQGFHLGTTLLSKLKRALIYYVERIQRENLKVPEVQTKNYQAHVEGWGKRPHGDHDDTPNDEWRQYK